jgi:hypothetical protein
MIPSKYFDYFFLTFFNISCNELIISNNNFNVFYDIWVPVNLIGVANEKNEPKLKLSLSHDDPIGRAITARFT